MKQMKMGEQKRDEIVGGGNLSTELGEYRSDYIPLVLGGTLRIKSYKKGHHTTWRTVLDGVREL